MAAPTAVLPAIASPEKEARRKNKVSFATIE